MRKKWVVGITTAWVLACAMLMTRRSAAVTGPTQGLSGYWTFDDGAGTSALDSSGFNHNATLVNGISWIIGKIGGAVQAHGTNDYINIPSVSLSSTTAVSVSLWANHVYSSAGGHTLFENSANFNNVTTGFGFFPDDSGTCGGGILVAERGNSGYNQACYRQPSSSVWHHFVAVYDKSQPGNNEVNLYIDGVLQTPLQRPSTSNNTNSFGNNPTYLFSRGGKTEFAAAGIDDFRLYDRALTAAEAQQLYNLGVGPDTTAPSVPTGLSASAASASQINLSWTASTDPDNTPSQINYEVFRNGTQVATATTASYSDTGLSASTTYSYTVAAFDPAGNVSAQSSSSSATTLPPPDTTPPSTPTGLTATSISPSQINLSWSASTDPDNTPAQISYVVYRNGVTVATVAVGTVSYSDTGLAAATTYSYTVSAQDPAGNASAQCSSVQAKTQNDTTPPSVPTNLSANAVSPSQINLTWTASTDPDNTPSQISFQVFRNNVQIATSTVASYSDTALAASTTYAYTVAAFDPAGNVSGQSGSASATTEAVQTVARVVQIANSTLALGATNASVSFSRSNTQGDAILVCLRYTGNVNLSSVRDTIGNAYSLVGSAATGITSSDGALAMYYASNIMGGSNTVNFTTSAASNSQIAAAEVSGLAFAGLDQSKFQANVISNAVVNTGTTVATAQANEYLAACGTSVGGNGNSWSSGSNYVLQTVPSVERLGYEDRNVSATGAYSATLTMGSSLESVGGIATFKEAVAGPDTTPPSVPTNLSANAVSPSQINLTWTGSTDPDNTASQIGYQVFRNNVRIATSAAASYGDTGLTASTTYAYTVAAFDPAGNVSTQSGSASATTLTPDTQPPTAPTNLTGNAVSSTQVNLSWTASTDNVGVAGYRVFRNSQQVATTTAVSYSDSGLAPSTSYTYAVSAFDAAGNVSPQSNLFAITTPSSSPIPGLTGYWKFDDGAGTVALDSSGGNHNATLVNGIGWAPGIIGGAVQAHGTTDYVSIPNIDLSASTAVSLSFWVNRAYSTGGGHTLIENTTNFNGAVTGFGLFPDDGGTCGGAIMVALNGNIGYSDNCYAQPSSNVWHHLAAIYDKTQPGNKQTALYIDGVLQAPISSPDTSQNTNTFGNNPFYVFSRGGTVEFNAGFMDDLRVYNRALTAAEVQQLYSLGSAPDTQPPTVPTNVSATAVSGSQINLTWTASTDNVGVAGYQVFRNGSQVGTPTSNSFSDTGLALSSTYSYAVAAFDAAGNVSAQSASASATTLSSSQLSPSAAELSFSETQQFNTTLSGATWSVDGVAGGSTGVGTITGSGLYTAPSAVGAHTIAANSAAGAQSALVYVTSYSGTLTYHNDTLRTGANVNEALLNPSNVNSSQFGKLFSYTVDGYVYGQPLYLPNVSIPGTGVHNVVYVVTEHDSVYAYDADNVTSTPLWHDSFINPGANITSVPSNDLASTPLIVPEVGITSTPVIDPTSGTIYVEAFTKEVGTSTSYVQRLHALDLTTGAEKFGGPVVIAGSVPGDGDNSVGGVVPFIAKTQLQREALLLSNGVIYVAFASHDDENLYHGWVMAYDATTLKQTGIFNDTPNGSEGGIWQGGSGPATDASGNVYVMTGNGTFDSALNGTGFPVNGDYGDAFLKFSPASGALNVADYFSPYNQAALSAADTDLGSGGNLLLPDQPGAHPHLMISAGKEGTIYVVDRDNMGHFNSKNNQIVQEVDAAIPNGLYDNPTLWQNNIYFCGWNDNIRQFQITNGLLSTSPIATSSATFGFPGMSLGVSANGSSNGILWGIELTKGQGILHAYDATNVAKELYNSTQAGTRDSVGGGVKFSVPTVANGKVYIGTQTQLVGYGLYQ